MSPSNTGTGGSGCQVYVASLFPIGRGSPRLLKYRSSLPLLVSCSTRHARPALPLTHVLKY